MSSVGRGRAVVDALSSGLDRMLLSAGGPKPRPTAVDPADHARRLRALRELAEELHGYTPDELWPAPRGLLVDDAACIGERRGTVSVEWRSGHEPLLGSAVRARLGDPRSAAAARARLSEPQNATAVARLFRSREPRKGTAVTGVLRSKPRGAVLLVHGYRGGRAGLERLLWPTSMIRRLGFDPCWPVLPFHGKRRTRRPGRPIFPGSNVAINVEALRQSVCDIRELVLWLRAIGYQEVGIAGFSLGGYVAALAATLEPRLDFAVAIAPCASLARFARQQGLLGGEPTCAELEAALDACYEPVSPLVRKSLVPPERWFVLVGQGDAVTGTAHARRLAAHTGAALWTGAGGHVLQAWRRRAWAPLQGFVATCRSRPLDGQAAS